MCWCTSGWVYWKLYHFSTRASYSFIVIEGWYNKPKVAAGLRHLLTPKEYKLKYELLMVNYHVQVNVLMFPAKSGADSKHNTAVTGTLNRGSGREERNEGSSAAAVCQHDACKWYAEQKATISCWRWKQKQSKSSYHFGLAVLESLEAGPSLQFLC